MGVDVASPTERNPVVTAKAVAWWTRAWWTGFRATVGLGLAVTSAVLLANAGLLGWAMTRPDTGVGTRVLFEGACADVAVRSTLAHLAINVLGTLLLASSNAAMQALCAPTRANLDVAHVRGGWLHVGVANVRNFLAIGPLRQIAWCALLLSSVPLHLLYNSVIIQSTSASEYYAVLATQDFSQGAPIDTQTYSPMTASDGATDLGLLHQIQNESASYTKLPLADCLSDYGTPFIKGRTNVVLVTNLTDWKASDTNSSALFSTFYSPNVSTLEYNLFYYSSAFQNGDEGYVFQPYVYSNGTIAYNEGFRFDSFGDPEQTFRRVQVDYCLSKEVAGVCAIELHPVFLIIVMVANMLKIASFLWLLLGVFPLHPLLTIDDAIASFLDHTDPQTKGGFALSETSHGALNRSKLQGMRQNGQLPSRSRRGWVNRKQRWSSALSAWQGMTLTLVIIAWLVMGAVALAQARESSASGDQPDVLLSEIWSNGFGNVYPSDVLPYTLQWSISSNIIWANAPQLVVSLIYVWYNQMISQMHATYESMRFAAKRDGLRVSSPPQGAQRRSYWLSLPLRYALSLMAVCAALHWALSQSLFLAEIVVQRADGSLKPSGDRINAVGYSLVGLLIMFILGSLMIVFLVVYSNVRRLPSGMPILSTCSLAIAAACHGHFGRPDEATRALQYGVVKVTGDKAGIVGFSSEEVEPLQDGWYYDGDASIPRTKQSSKTIGSDTEKPL